MFIATFVSLIPIKLILVLIEQFKPIFIKVYAQNCGTANIFAKHTNFKIYLNIWTINIQLSHIFQSHLKIH